MRTVLPALLTLLYPLLVFFGMAHFEPRVLALLLLALALLRAVTSKQRIWQVATLGAMVLAGLSLSGNQLLPLKLYPVLVNTLLLAVFGASLIKPPSMIERIARLKTPDLPLAAILYTRKVTMVWCVFFAVNGVIALFTALVASDAVWAFYNGGLAYVLMGLLFAGEWLYRQRVQAAGTHG